MILCDTNILISFFISRQDTIDELEKIGHNNVLLPATTVMELYRGASNKKELNLMKKRIKYYDVLHANRTVSKMAVDFIDKYHLSHGLQIPDAMIAASALIFDLELFTYNLKDFSFIPELKLNQPEI